MTDAKQKIGSVEQLRDAALERFTPLLTAAAFTEAEQARFARAIKRCLHWSAEEVLAAQAGRDGARDHAIEQRAVCLDTLEQAGLLRIARASDAFTGALAGFVTHVIEVGTPIAAAAAQSASAAIVAKLGR